jgi:uncharacterized membrane protein YhaH (DUF805 family)
MSPIDWAIRPMQKYADFSGRASRPEYWWFVLGLIVTYIVISIVESILGINRMIGGVYGPLMVLLWLATIVPQISVGVRRLHDTNRSGWWLLLPLIPYCLAFILGGSAMLSGSITGLGVAGIFLMIGAVCAIVLLVFMILPGTPGDNRYGPVSGGAASAVTA